MKVYAHMTVKQIPNGIRCTIKFLPLSWWDRLVRFAAPMKHPSANAP